MRATKTDWQVAALSSIPRHLRERAGMTDPAKMLDMAINLRARIKLNLETGNACAVLRMVRNRGERLQTYMAWAANEYRKAQPARAATYRRWHRRMTKRG